MTFQEFHAAVGAIAGDRYFAASVEVSTHPARGKEERHDVAWRGYVDGGPIANGNSPESVLTAMQGDAKKSIAAIGDDDITDVFSPTDEADDGQSS